MGNWTTTPDGQLVPTSYTFAKADALQSRVQIMDADRVVMDEAGVPLEASLTVGMAHRNIVRTVAWVTDRSSRAAPASAPPSAPTSRAASNDISDGCAVLSTTACAWVCTPTSASHGAHGWGCLRLQGRLSLLRYRFRQTDVT